MRLLVTALTLTALTLVACGRDTALKETPEQIKQEQAAADAHNASTVPFAGDDETPNTDAPSTTTTAVPEYEGANALRVGDCVDLPTTSTASVRAISCDRPHHGEVTARIDIGARFPNGAPTRADFQQINNTDCKRAFDGYVRQPPPGEVGVSMFEIRAEEWYLGEHTVICTADAYKEGNVLTGSIRKPA